MLIAAIKIAIVSFVYSALLTEPNMILNKFYVALSMRFGYLAPQEKQKLWLFYPIIHCSKCVAGQVALWYYIAGRYDQYNAWDHIVFVAGAILLTHILVKHAAVE